jgi:hypothetical protein
MNHNYKTQRELLQAQSEGKRFILNGSTGPFVFDLSPNAYTLVNEPVQPVSKKRKHADVIIAWANGEDVQILSGDGVNWHDVDQPLFAPNTQYRVKPKEQTNYYIARSTCLINSTEQDANVKMVYCGSTGELLSVEKIK